MFRYEKARKFGRLTTVIRPASFGLAAMRPKTTAKGNTSERPEDNDDDDDNNDDQQSSYTRARKHSHTHTRRLDGDHPQINYSFYGGAIFIVFPTRPGLIGFGLVARAVPGPGGVGW